MKIKIILENDYGGTISQQSTSLFPVAEMILGDMEREYRESKKKTLYGKFVDEATAKNN